MLIEMLQRQSGLSRSQLLHLSETASKRYKIYTIAKRNGGRRKIAHPGRALKSIQRWINKALISDFPVHNCATAYKKGASIRTNALVHARSCFTLRTDFVSFFPSFRIDGIRRFISSMDAESNFGLSEEDIDFVCAISTRNSALTIGAPSSPAITNAMMYEFDSAVFSLAREGGLSYTRYADDLFISSGRAGGLDGVLDKIVEIKRNYQYANLRINRKKTAYLSRRYKRSITGLVITPEGIVSIGRGRKREIKALIHKELNGTLEERQLDRVRGLMAFAMGVDPEFYSSLQRKYGGDNLRRILGQPTI